MTIFKGLVVLPSAQRKFPKSTLFIFLNKQKIQFFGFDKLNLIRDSHSAFDFILEKYF